METKFVLFDSIQTVALEQGSLLPCIPTSDFLLLLLQLARFHGSLDEHGPDAECVSHIHKAMV